MILPTPAEEHALKAYALAKFGSSRPMVVRLSDPVDAAIVVVPFDLESFKIYRDLRFGPARTAHASAVVTRSIWCSPPAEDLRGGRGPKGSIVGGGAVATAPVTIDTLVPTEHDPDPIHRVALDRTRALCATWPAVDAQVADQLEDAAGWAGNLPVARPLDASAPPPGLTSEDAIKLLSGKPTKGPGSLWAVTSSHGLSMVMQAPLPNIWHAAQGARASAEAARGGILAATLIHAKPLVVWCPGTLDAYLDERPGYADVLHKPLADMGGAAAKASASFL